MCTVNENYYRIYVRLSTRSKLFCTCTASTAQQSAESGCPICQGIPGTLPIVNKKAVELAIKAGLLLGCEVQSYVRFERTACPLCESPKAYRITQNSFPIAKNGSVLVADGEHSRLIPLKKLCLTEMAVPSADRQMSGIPALEITLSEPVSAELLETVAEQIRLLLQFEEPGSIADQTVESFIFTQSYDSCAEALSYSPEPDINPVSISKQDVETLRKTI